MSAANDESRSTAKLERMAIEAGATMYAQTLCINGKDAHDFLFRFANLVAEAEREACGEIANKKAADVLAKNTYRGRTNTAASFAASMLEDVGASIRMRSNV